MDELSFFEAVASTPLLQRALTAGALAGLCCATLSPLIVLKRMAFVGDGIAHASFGGIGLGLFILAGSRYEDVSVQLVTLAYCLTLGVAIGLVSRKAHADSLAEDSAIGIAFSVSIALGLLFIALRQRRDPQYVPSLDTYLFGSPLNISGADVILLLVVSAAAIGALVLFFKEIQFYAFDARLAEVSGVKMDLIHYLFILMLVVIVVIASRVVGIVLVSASTVLPGIIALKLCKRLMPAMVLAGIVGVLSFELGMYFAYTMNLHPGSTIILLQFVLAAAAAVCKRLQAPAHADAGRR